MLLTTTKAWLPSLLLLAATRTLAQTTTSCNPTEKTCPSDTALDTALYTHDFTTTALDTSAWNITAGNVTHSSAGLSFTVTKSGDAPTIRSKWYIFFGRVSFVMKSAPGTGIVSSAILESDDLDEIDLEWLGGSDTIVQTNYFGKGNTTTHDREVDAAVTAAETTSHNYTIVWTSTKTEWLVDGVVKRTLASADASDGANYPQTPMDVRIGIWAGGDSGNAEGTIEWAGGETNYDDGPFTMVLEKVEVENYNPAKSYSYGDKTGDADSIVIDKEGSSSSSSTASATAKPSGTGTATVSAGSSGTGTATGMWWTASASAVSKSETSEAVVRKASVWAYVVGSVLAMLV